jgi:hypothetical protein
VSLNDGKLYGVDLRFSSDSEGKLCTHVLPFVVGCTSVCAELQKNSASRYRMETERTPTMTS